MTQVTSGTPACDTPCPRDALFNYKPAAPPIHWPKCFHHEARSDDGLMKALVTCLLHRAIRIDGGSQFPCEASFPDSEHGKKDGNIQR
jgi:hypothetical protein